MKSKNGILSSKFFPIIVFLVFELILFVLRFMYVIDHNLYKLLSFTQLFLFYVCLRHGRLIEKNI